MRKLVFTAIIAALTLSVAVPAFVRAADPVAVTASNWKFTPGTITVHVNEATTLRITSKEGVHGITAPELGIPSTTLPPDKSVSVTFTPKKTGTYELHCSIPCGPGHADMKLTIKVV